MLIRWNGLAAKDFEPYRDRAAVVLNFASTEQHSLHLPVGTDAFLGAAVTEAAAQRCASPILLLPQVCFGYSPHHRFAPGYITIPQQALIAYACGICESVRENGFKRMFLINSHGGNHVFLSAVINEMGERCGADFDLKLLNYWDVAADGIGKIRTSELGGTGHAGEFETAMMLHLHPELVSAGQIKEYAPVPGDPWYRRDLVGFKKYQRYADFNEVNPEGHMGQPHLATPEKGKLFFEAVTQALADFLDHFNR